jgi:hypothetical protein
VAALPDVRACRDREAGRICWDGRHDRRPGSILLLLFRVPTTLIFHHEVADPQQRIQLFKNLSIMGGLLLLADRGHA